MHASRSHSQESPFATLITACMHVIILRAQACLNSGQITLITYKIMTVLGSGSRHKLDGRLVAQPHRTEEPEIIHYRRNKVNAYRDVNRRIGCVLYVWLYI